MKTVIYLDVLLLVNYVMAWFLLKGASLLAGVPLRFGRLVGAAALAAFFSMILFAPELPYPVQVAYKLSSGAAVVWAAIGRRGWRRFFACWSWYCALNLLVAGLCMLVILRTKTPLLQTGNLSVYLRVSPLLLLGLTAACWLAIEIFQRIAGQTELPTDTVGVEFDLAGCTVRLRATLDTGCHLKDPITCLPVLLVSYPDAKSRLPEPVCCFLEDWFSGGGATAGLAGAKLRLIPCSTASDRAVLPGFAVGEIGVILKDGIGGAGRSTVAFSSQPFGSENYEALYGKDFF